MLSTYTQHMFHSVTGAGQMCCYDENGLILPFANGGGTLLRSHVKGSFSNNTWKIPIVSHFLDDVWPQYLCSKLSVNSAMFAEVRPTDNCNSYQPPFPGKQQRNELVCFNNSMYIMCVEIECVGGWVGE